MQHDFSAYTVESLEETIKDIETSLKIWQRAKIIFNSDISGELCNLYTDLISMLSEAKTKSLAFRKGMEHKIDTLKIKANYK